MKSTEQQLQLDNLPKKQGRPKTGSAMTNAERSRKAREKKRASKIVTINTSLSLKASLLYSQMIDSGYDINLIIEMAYNQAPLSSSVKRVTKR